jgi:transposase
MEQERRKYDREFKLEAIRLWQTTKRSAREVEDDLGITRGRLYRWKQQLKIRGEGSFPGHGRMPAADEELRKLRRELEIVKQERDILHLPWRAALALCASTCVPGKKAVAMPWLSRSQANEVPVHRRRDELRAPPRMKMNDPTAYAQAWYTGD